MSDSRACVLLLHGDADRHIPVAHGRLLAASAPRAHYLELHEEDHLSLPMRIDLLAPMVEQWFAANPQPQVHCPAPLQLPAGNDIRAALSPTLRRIQPAKADGGGDVGGGIEVQRQFGRRNVRAVLQRTFARHGPQTLVATETCLRPTRPGNGGRQAAHTGISTRRRCPLRAPRRATVADARWPVPVGRNPGPGRGDVGPGSAPPAPAPGWRRAPAAIRGLRPRPPPGPAIVAAAARPARRGRPAPCWRRYCWPGARSAAARLSPLRRNSCFA